MKTGFSGKYLGPDGIRIGNGEGSTMSNFIVVINLPLFSTVVPSSIFMFLSCRPLVVITTLSTGLVGVGSHFCLLACAVGSWSLSLIIVIVSF